MLLNVVQMQQKLTALEDVPKTTQQEQVKKFFLYVTALQSVFFYYNIFPSFIFSFLNNRQKTLPSPFFSPFAVITVYNQKYLFTSISLNFS